MAIAVADGLACMGALQPAEVFRGVIHASSLYIAISYQYRCGRRLPFGESPN
jgi:hypothetical protein